MNHNRFLSLSVCMLLFLVICATLWATPAAALDPSQPPSQTLKLIFIHHSCGENWLADEHGRLGLALRNNNYFVSDTYYGWDGGGVGIGDRTDIGNWWEWFLGPDHDAILAALYAESDQATSFSRMSRNPGGENQIVMFKSCFPNSNLMGNGSDPPKTGPNPLRGQDCYSPYHTVANAKAIYRDLLGYFQTRPDKLFIAITAPPVMDGTYAANARAFNTWLVNDWLDSYPLKNVRVWDFYNVLTSNGGDWHTNDFGSETGNHHRYQDGAIQYITTEGGNTAAYPEGNSDDHPSAAGNRKATGEFVPLLNLWVNEWLGGGEVTPQPTPSATAGTPTATATRQPSPTTGSPTSEATPESTASPTLTPTTPYGEQVMVFQRGLLPNPSYDSAPDAVLSREEHDANLGGYETLEVFWGEQENRRSLVRWDLSLLPADANVQQATLYLLRYDGDAAREMTVAVYALTSDWVEGTGNDFWPQQPYTADGATWNMATAYDAWIQPGGDYDATTDYGLGIPGVVGRVVLPAGMGVQVVSIDITRVVQAWAKGTIENYGLLLRPLDGEGTYHYFRSGDFGDPSQRPRLTIRYRLGGEPEPTVTAAPTNTPRAQLLLPLLMKS